MTAEESTDGEVEAQTYNQDSQDSIGEVRVFEKTNILISAEIAIFLFQTLKIFRNEISNQILQIFSGNHL